MCEIDINSIGHITTIKNNKNSKIIIIVGTPILRGLNE